MDVFLSLHPSYFPLSPFYFPPVTKRLLWLDAAKGLAILWVVYFHFFNTYFDRTLLAAGLSGLPPARVLLKLVWLKVSGLGFHAVSVFIILSGWALYAIDRGPRRVGPGGVGNVVSRALLASLSNVLGCAFGLPDFAVRRAL